MTDKQQLATVAMPVNLRTDDDPAGGNRFAGARIAAPIGEPDPARRILLIREQVLTAPAELVEDGYMRCPTGPGWGVELNEEFLRAHQTIFVVVTAEKFAGGVSNMPTRQTSGGTICIRRRARFRSAPIYRGDPATKLNPSASAP